MASPGICKRSDGRWCGHIQVNGKRMFVYGKTRQEVKAKLDTLRSHVGLTPENWSRVKVRLGPKKGGVSMGRRTHTAEQIIGKLREAELLLGQGASVAEASKGIGVTEQTYYRWGKEYGGMQVEQARRLRDLRGRTAASRSWWQTCLWTTPS